MSSNSIVKSEKPPQAPRSLIWTIILYVGVVLIIPCVLFIDLSYLQDVILSLVIINVLLVVLLYIGMKRHQQVKDKDRSVTTFSRKMFNIIAGLLFAFFIWIFNPWVAFFILLGVDYAFGIHEFIYVVLKKKIYFTDAFIALGRQTEPHKPYLASIMALFAFTITLGFQTSIFQYFGILQLYQYSLIIIYTATVLIWGIGDTAAYFAGTRYGNHKLPWNKKKSWEGFFANMAVGIGLGILFFAPFMLPFLTTMWWILLALIGGLAGAFFESINLQLDDNFVTPVFTGLILGLVIVIVFV
ncbi:MAG: hypothetical protein HWN66_06995 [Candidatus Helarchaeota archaeon]|nr:hypothetical protein [Candidatus Helarchaeota archaeon]